MLGNFFQGVAYYYTFLLLSLACCVLAVIMHFKQHNVKKSGPTGAVHKIQAIETTSIILFAVFILCIVLKHA